MLRAVARVHRELRDRGEKKDVHEMMEHYALQQGDNGITRRSAHEVSSRLCSSIQIAVRSDERNFQPRRALSSCRLVKSAISVTALARSRKPARESRGASGSGRGTGVAIAAGKRERTG